MPFDAPYQIVLDPAADAQVHLKAAEELHVAMLLIQRYHDIESAKEDAITVAKLVSGVPVHVQCNGFTLATIQSRPLQTYEIGRVALDP